jgi:hypothetical protein
LLGLPNYYGKVLTGDEASGYEIPGVVQLVPLLEVLGGAATLSATARVVADHVPEIRDSDGEAG